LITNNFIEDGKDRWRSGSVESSRVLGLNGQCNCHLVLVKSSNFVWAHTHFLASKTEVAAGVDLVFVGPQSGLSQFQRALQNALGVVSANPMGHESGGVICLTSGTRIRTPEGSRLVQDLRIGDMVQTKDNGAQEIVSKDARRMTGASMFAMPHLRPIRMGALGVERPDEELFVSPSLRMLIQEDEVMAMFNTPKILVAAKDLINGKAVTVNVTVQQVKYIHLLLSNHQMLWANGVETQSFHPASAALKTLEGFDRKRRLPNSLTWNVILILTVATLVVTFRRLKLR
jgi:hypothetical protein